ncbi:hypothetical protein F0562_028717 [Nyssa sinensis]|uniref:Plant basic secretory protein (BSP) family protein n=1 Tax=Nyssa sinensis TaxID=561372 RepID=A0A5J5B0Q0_9ASTE|nr:hypothetical protein F0562_028717 [Nyssa sinensis]
MARMMFCFSSLLILVLAALQGIHAVEYSVTNKAGTTPGGVRFTNEIGVDYCKQTLISATDFIWSLFQQNTAADRKDVPQVSLFIDTVDGVAYTVNNQIYVSANYIQGYSGDVKQEITGVIYHEMTHVWQWNGNGQSTPGGLIEGIADFVRLKAGFVPSHWVQPGQGNSWDQGYDVTARFLDYCDSLRNGFVAELNKKMRSGYSANFFVDLLGKTVDQLWILDLAALPGIHAVDYIVTNNAGTTPGGVRFTNEIGLEYSRQTLISATDFIWRLFQQNTAAADRKNVSRVSLFIENPDGVGYSINNEIHVSANYIRDYAGDVKREIIGSIYHKMAHIWLWNGNGQSPGWLLEGIADFVRLKAGYASSHWVQPGQGDRWAQGYDVTARFLDYCNSLRNEFMAELNKKLRSGYSANYFVELLGKTVEQALG